MRFATRLMSSVPMIGAGLLLTSVPQLSAQELNNYISLDTLTVYATRSEQSLFDVPGTTTVVDANAAGNATAGTLADLFQFTPGVEVDGGPRRNGQTISIRGIDDEGIITLIDGRRQNFESGHDGRFFLDPNLLKRVEIVKGASSSIYGGGAIGGVVAFETKEAADLLEPGQIFGSMASFGYRSANEEISPSLSVYGQTGGWDILGNITYRGSQPIEQGDDEELFTKDYFGSGLLNLGYKPDDFNTYKINLKASINDGKEPNSGDSTITSSNPVIKKEVEDYQIGFKYAYNNPADALLAPKFHIYYNDTSVNEENTSGTNQGRVRDRNYTTLGLTLDNQSKINHNSYISSTLSYGAELILNDQKTSDSTGVVFGGAPNAEATQYGFYLQNEISMKSSLGELLLIPAARFDSFESEDDSGNSQNETAISPKIAVSYKPVESIALFGSVAQAFRAPNLTETYAAGQHFPGFFGGPFLCPPGGLCPDNNFVPNPNLKPETVTTFEVGAKYRTSQLLTDNDQFSISGTYYRTKGRDFITQQIDIPGGTTTNINVDNAKLEGFEAEAQYQLNPVTLKLGASFNYARDEDTNNFLTNYVPLTFVTDISYKFEEQNTVIGWRSRIAEANDKVAGTGLAETAGYDVHDIYLRWAPEMNARQNLIVDLGVSNVFDAAYQKRFSTLFAEGRSFLAKATYKW